MPRGMYFNPRCGQPCGKLRPSDDAGAAADLANYYWLVVEACAVPGAPDVEGSYGADSSMTAVMGRMATYSGQKLTWEQAIKSDVHWAPKTYALDADPPNLPDADGSYTAAVPGVFKF